MNVDQIELSYFSQPVKEVCVEVWEDIPGAPDYQASNLGRIRSWKSKTWKILRATLHSNTGYLIVSLRVDRKYMTRSVHRLIALTFLGPAHGRDVNHKNGKKQDNHLVNLEYLTRGENHCHAYRTGLRTPVGRKLSPRQVREIRALGRDVTQTELAKRFGVSRSTIGKILHHQTHLPLATYPQGE